MLSENDGDNEKLHYSNLPFVLKDEVAVGLDNTYILYLCGQCSTQPNIVAALSDYTCAVYDIAHLKKTLAIKEHDGPITGVKFSHDNNLVYSSSLDGTIKVFDLRSNACIKEFKDDLVEPTKLKPLNCFDISNDENFICAGTEVIDADAFILFWDLRSTKLLGGYWESHTEAITQVKFHPKEESTLATGSIDGLINIFDISKETEDDAFVNCLNTEASVEKLEWFLKCGNDGMACITPTEDLQLWMLDDVTPFSSFSRETITKSLKYTSVDDTYIVDIHNGTDDELIVVAGSTIGDRKHLCTACIRNEMTSLQPHSLCSQNKQIVRSSLFNTKAQLLVTGGESGLLSVWQQGDLLNSHSECKIHSKVKSKPKPYDKVV